MAGLKEVRDQPVEPYAARRGVQEIAEFTVADKSVLVGQDHVLADARLQYVIDSLVPEERVTDAEHEGGQLCVVVASQPEVRCAVARFLQPGKQARCQVGRRREAGTPVR